VIIFIRPISLSDFGSLSEVYREVFSGFPWYEDLACKTCKALYTNKNIKEDSKDRVFSLGNLENCLKCNSPLDLISYYPDVINQDKLIEEAINMSGFSGYVVLDGSRIIGFTWGYSIPTKRTESVNFPQVVPALQTLGIDPSQAFYGAESGVIESYQSKGIGKLLVSKRTLAAFESDYKTFVNRTINPRMRAVLKNIFSGTEPKVLFKDPETGSQWFSWDFRDFSYAAVKKNLFGEKYD
jgi:hypothetical protein